MRADETSWPYNNPGGDEPDWTAGDGHPSWPANGNTQDWPRADGGPAAPRREPAAALHHDPRMPTAPPPPAPVARVRVPASGDPDGGQRPGPRGAAGPAGAPYYEVAFGEGRV